MYGHLAVYLVMLERYFVDQEFVYMPGPMSGLRKALGIPDDAEGPFTQPFNGNYP